MKVLYFGSYSSVDPRNLVLIEGLRENGVEVIECHDDSPGLKKYIRLFLKHWRLRNSYDAMVVGFLGQTIIPFAAFINLPFISFRPRKPLIFDAFLSLYDSNVFSRGIVNPGSLKAGYYWFIDWFSMQFGDAVLFDTQQHIDYISKEFGIPLHRMRKIFVGAREDIFHPMEFRKTGSRFQVLFYGTFIRSQGVEYILQAAKILEREADVDFLFIGDGQVKKEMVAYANTLQLKNATFCNFMSPPKIAEHIARADVCLGLFGKPEKIRRVIPTKVYECIAMNRPVITADTPGIRELLGDRDACLVHVADPEGIAHAITTLKNNTDARSSIARGGYRKFRSLASRGMLGKELIDIITAVA